MKTPHRSRTFLVSVVSFAAVASAGVALAAPASAKFELPRLKANGNPHDASALARANVTVDELAPNAGGNAREGAGQKVRHLKIDGGTAWSRPLRGGPKDTVFVSFFVYGSENTIIEAAGARLRIRAGATPGYAQLQAGSKPAPGEKLTWINFGGPVKLERHGGKSLAALPVLTVRLDRAAGTWDLFVAHRLALTDRPLAALPVGAPNQFTVRAGADGALVSGLVSADENPLCEDANANGIEDAFERARHGGALLPAGASAAERAPVARAWQLEQQARNVAPWPVQRPRPDGAPNGPTTPVPPGKKK